MKNHPSLKRNDSICQ